jgi:hypothetical protein
MTNEESTGIDLVLSCFYRVAFPHQLRISFLAKVTMETKATKVRSRVGSPFNQNNIGRHGLEWALRERQAGSPALARSAGPYVS